MSNIEQWVWLSRVFMPGSPKPKKLLDSFGEIEEIYAATSSDYKKSGVSLRETEITRLEDKGLSHVQKIISDCGKHNIRIIPICDSEYPERLKNIPEPPVLLYARGERLVIDDEVAIAVVGTRNASKNGEAAAKKLGRELAEGGAVTVTGLAKGVDSIAAESAIAAGGVTVAVFGCGLDICYPRENKNLMAATEKSGTVISEYCPGTPPAGRNFPIRNRIISGLSLGTTVVEAPEKSGALITASCALEQGRDVFAVPSSIFEDTGSGSNRLICEGAKPVRSANDILSEYIHLYGEKIRAVDPVSLKEDIDPADVKGEFMFPKGYLEKFSGDNRTVIEALAGDELRPDEISARSGLPMPKVLTVLTVLEIYGNVKKLAGGKIAIKDIQ